ncbi:MAG: small-conductance mechanosensitive channel, partial [Ilumatobacter sp.]
CEVGTGSGLGEQLAPPLFAGEHRAEKTLLHRVIGVCSDRGAGEGHEEGTRMCRLGTGCLETLFDHTVQLGAQAQSAVALGEMDPGEASIEACSAERHVVHLLGIVCGEQRVERVVDQLRLGIGRDRTRGGVSDSHLRIVADQHSRNEVRALDVRHAHDSSGLSIPASLCCCWVRSGVVLHLTDYPELADDSASTLSDACGLEPKFICERVFEATDGNETLTELVDWLIGRPLSVLIIVLVAWIVTRVAQRYVRRLVTRIVAPDRTATARRLAKFGIDDPTSIMGAEADPRRDARATSISDVVGSTITVLIWVVAIILVVGEFGFDLGPFIAGAGIAGVALGFGAQSLVKDCISGLFMLVEDQYGIGDIVDLGEAIGEVEQVTLRTTVVRGLDGTVWHVPNGEVQRVGNKSQLWSVALVDIDVAYDSDITAAKNLMLSTATEVCASEQWSPDVLDEPIVLGVESLGADGITLRMIVKTSPGSQWALQRELREALKASYDSAGIEIPFPQRTVWVRGDTTELGQSAPTAH